MTKGAERDPGEKMTCFIPLIRQTSASACMFFLSVVNLVLSIEILKRRCEDNIDRKRSAKFLFISYHFLYQAL